MQILSVALKNFKTHRDRAFTFAPGTNAICGENGAGKTSILEAIAWALFNYQGDYAKDDLIRNGSGSAEVTVEFISNLDGRTYTVQRSTTKGYALFDPQLGTRLPYARIKDEVLPWLREHLGVAPGTDLGELFARTIGVPQGTFTADFLQSTENRKAVFDRILKVEEYKTVHRDLNGLRRYAEAKVEEMERDIAQYEERLQAWDDLNQRHQALTSSIQHDEARLVTLQAQLAALQQTRDTLKAQADRVQTLQTQIQQATAQIDAQRQTQALLAQSLAQAQQAATLCEAARPAYAAYQAAETQLQALGQHQGERQALQKKQQQLQKTLATRAADLTRLRLQLDGFAEATAEIDRLQPQVQAQSQLETEFAALQQAQQALAQVRGTVQAMAQQQSHRERQIAQAQRDLDRLQALTATVARIPDLEQQRDRLQQQISRLEAARQFEAELTQLVQRGQRAGDRHAAQTHTALQTLEALQQSIPLLSGDAVTALQQALEAGVAVNQEILGAVQGILTDLATQTDAKALSTQLQATQRQLKALAQQQAEVATLPQRQQQLTELQRQQTAQAQQMQDLQQQLAAETTLTAEATRLQTAIAALQDPRGRCAVLGQALSQQAAVEKRYSEMQAAQSGIQTQIDDLETQLHAFAELEAAIASQNQLKQTHQPGYLQYLQNEKAAGDQARFATDLAAAQTSLGHLEQELATLQQTLQTAQSDYDPQQGQTLEVTYQDTRSQWDRLSGSLPQQQQLLQELQQQMDALKDLAEKRDAATVERKNRDRIKRFINFARKAYKEAGPRITERYVHQISYEADRLFRELLNRPNVALTWTRDYEIQVQEGASTRRFVNLSGGEQMCAALAVRLALLKVLADIDIAFFDEPTTNMDRPRRESLAEAIARIKSFSQLFVISHDDTFEKVTENVIFVEREP